MNRKKKINYIIDLGLIISFLLLFFTGLLKYPGLLLFFGFGNLKTFLPELSFVHDLSGIVLSILILLHLILNWSHLVRTTKELLNGVTK